MPIHDIVNKIPVVCYFKNKCGAKNSSTAAERAVRFDSGSGRLPDGGSAIQHWSLNIGRDENTVVWILFAFEAV